jgi:hypothetical protein
VKACWWANGSGKHRQRDRHVERARRPKTKFFSQLILLLSVWSRAAAGKGEELDGDALQILGIVPLALAKPYLTTRPNG